MKGLVNCNFLPGTPDGLSLAQFQPSPCRARVLVAKLRPLGETVSLSRARTSGESPDSAQAGRGPQWPIHRISAPANDAVRLPGARRLERQMTVTDGRVREQAHQYDACRRHCGLDIWVCAAALLCEKSSHFRLCGVPDAALAIAARVVLVRPGEPRTERVD